MKKRIIEMYIHLITIVIKSFMNHTSFTLSNLLTLLRIVFTPFIVWAIVTSHWYVAVVLFGIAAITDFFDGLLARLWHEETQLGAWLDPVADKILVLSSLSTLLFIHMDLPQWFVALVGVRELSVLLGVGLLARFLKNSIIVKPTYVSKLATCAQLLLIGWIMIAHSISLVYSMPAIIILMYISALLVIISLIQYTITGFRLIFQ